MLRASAAVAVATSAAGFVPRRAFEPSIGSTGSPDRAQALRDGGVEFLEVSCQRELIPGDSDAAFDRRLDDLAECALPIRAANGFLPGKLACTGPEADHGAVLEWAETVFARAARVGIRHITFGSAGARSLPFGYPASDADLQFVAVLAKMAPLAAAHGVSVCVENLQRRETNYVNTVADAARLVGAVQHASIALTADVFHMLREGEDPESIVRAGERVRHVHIAEKANRTPPGVDGDDFRPFLRALRAAGYAGGISIECGWKDVAKQAGPAVETLREQLRSLDG